MTQANRIPRFRAVVVAAIVLAFALFVATVLPADEGTVTVRPTDNGVALVNPGMGWPHEFLQENRDLVRRINVRLGYRIQLVEASWPKTARARGSFSFTSTWRNSGVAPCLPGGNPAITLKDSQGGIVGVFVDEAFDVRTLPVAAPGEADSQKQKANFHLPFQLVGGEYDVYVSIGTRTGIPKIALPLEDNDGQRRYLSDSIPSC